MENQITLQKPVSTIVNADVLIINDAIVSVLSQVVNI